MSTRVEQARDILDETFGKNGYMNKHLSETLPQIYDDAKAEPGFDSDRAEHVQREVGNYIWYAYSGGDTCYNAADRMIALWDEE